MKKYIGLTYILWLHSALDFVNHVHITHSKATCFRDLINHQKVKDNTTMLYVLSKVLGCMLWCLCTDMARGLVLVRLGRGANGGAASRTVSGTGIHGSPRELTNRFYASTAGLLPIPVFIFYQFCWLSGSKQQVIHETSDRKEFPSSSAASELFCTWPAMVIQIKVQ